MIGIAVLGSTGSIGVSTLDVVARHADRFRVHTLAARSDHGRLLAQCLLHRPQRAILEDAKAAQELRVSLRSSGLPTRVECGSAALCEAVRDPEVAVVMAAIVGAAGLPSTIAAASAVQVGIILVLVVAVERLVGLRRIVRSPS